MKTILYGDGESEPSPELVAQLSQEVYQNDLLQLLVQNIQRFDFEVILVDCFVLICFGNCDLNIVFLVHRQRRMWLRYSTIC